MSKTIIGSFSRFLLPDLPLCGRTIDKQKLARDGSLPLPPLASLALSDFFHGAVCQHVHHDFSFSAIDELIQHDLFRPVLDAVHTSNPLHLIGSLEHLGYVFLLLHLPDDKLHALVAGMVCLSEMLIEFAGQDQIGEQNRTVLSWIIPPIIGFETLFIWCCCATIDPDPSAPVLRHRCTSSFEGEGMTAGG